MKAIIVTWVTGAALAFAAPVKAQTISLESAPPVVVKTVPAAGATDVDPALAEIKVTYSKTMQDGNMSWSMWGEENYPETTGEPKYLQDGRTCVLPVKLQPNKFYALWLNSEKFKNFKDTAGRPAVPYLLTFYTGDSAGRTPGRTYSNAKPYALGQTSAASTATGALIPIPKPEELPGDLKFHGRYRHRSRGSDIDTPSELWVKESAGGTLNALARLPFKQSVELASGDPQNRLTSYQIASDASRDRPGYSMALELHDGMVKLTRRGVRQDVDGKELKVPAGAWFDPNSRPDAYCAANLLLRAFALGEGETKEFRVYDWDNSGEGFVDYTIRVKHAGKEKVEAPAGTFNANHLVLTQTSSADTWFKKRAGHVTEFWVLDNHVIVRVLRHREPYEIVLLDYSVPQKLTAVVPSADGGGVGQGGRHNTDQVIVEHLALQMLAAIRDKDDATLKSLATDSVKPGWRDALPQFAAEMREHFVKMTDKSFAMHPAESLIEDDHAVVKCTGPETLGGTYLVLSFVKLDDSWQNWSLRNSPASTPLKEHLKQHPSGARVQGK